MKKRVLAILLAMIMLVSIVPAFAESDPLTYTCPPVYMTFGPYSEDDSTALCQSGLSGLKVDDGGVSVVWTAYALDPDYFGDDTYYLIDYNSGLALTNEDGTLSLEQWAYKEKQVWHVEWLEAGAVLRTGDTFTAENDMLFISYDENGSICLKSTEDESALMNIEIYNCKFADVRDSNTWYYYTVNQAGWNGFVQGYGDGTVFGTDRNITRAEFLTLLYRSSYYFEGCGEFDSVTLNFKDVPAGCWYEEALKWAVSNNLVEGYGDGTFRANRPITRQEIAAMLYRYHDNIDEISYATYYEDTPSYEDYFKDASDVSPWAKEYIQWAFWNYVLEGDGNGYLYPLAYATRQEAVAMIYRVGDN